MFGMLAECSEKIDVRLLESVQRRGTTEIPDVSHLAYVERLNTFELFSIFGRFLRSDFIKMLENLSF